MLCIITFCLLIVVGIERQIKKADVNIETGVTKAPNILMNTHFASQLTLNLAELQWNQIFHRLSCDDCVRQT